MSSIQNNVQVAKGATGPLAAKPSGTPAQTPAATPGGINNGPKGDVFTSRQGLVAGYAQSTPGGTPSGTPLALPNAIPGGAPGGAPSGAPAGAPAGTPSAAPAGTPEGGPDGANSSHANTVLQALADLDAPDDLIEAYKEQYRLLGMYDDGPSGGAPAGSPGGAPAAGTPAGTPGGAPAGANAPVPIADVAKKFDTTQNGQPINPAVLAKAAGTDGILTQAEAAQLTDVLSTNKETGEVLPLAECMRKNGVSAIDLGTGGGTPGATPGGTPGGAPG